MLGWSTWRKYEMVFNTRNQKGIEFLKEVQRIIEIKFFLVLKTTKKKINSSGPY